MLSLFLRYLGIAFGIALVIVLFHIINSTGQLRGFWHGMSLLFWLTFSPGIGLFIGALIKQWLRPDAIYTQEGALGIAKAKLFWAIGPQSIGWLLGLLSVGNHL
ncbi:TPA: hypothetical protein VEO38_001853 [Providencia alcalifaciens]|nr:hypothetical protein [Providencia alcalifaciens]